MRSEKVLKSSIWQLIYQVTIMLLGFFVPRFVILTYGSEINGLQSTIVQMLNIIALMNAGAITASVYELYKPFASNDIESIKATLSNSVKYFLYVGIAFFFIMVILAFVVSGTLDYSLEQYEIIIAFFILGLKSTIDIMFTSKYRIVFAADQKQHLTSIGMLIENVVYYLLLFVILFTKQYFLFMYASLLAGCLIKQFFFELCYKKYYNILKIDYKIKYKRPSNANYAMINEISHTVVTSSIMIIIPYLHGLSSASVYSVYALVNTALVVFSNVLMNSFSPSFGNMIASGDKNGASNIFRNFHCVFSFMNSVLYACSAFLIISFVKIYTKGSSDVDYISNSLGIIICFYGLINTYRIPFNILVSTNGLFKETWKQPPISAVLSIVISFMLGIIDFSFVLLGPLFFYLSNFIYQFHYMKTHNIENGIDRVLVENAISLFLVSLAMIISRILNLNFESIFSWIIFAVISFAICFVIAVFLYFIFDKKTLTDSSKYLYTAFISRLKRR